jgi:hypothetical protein
MWLIDRIAEERIRQAQREGAFDDLPGAGRPLALEDEPLLPEELRVAYRILRNSGHLPPEVGLRREIRDAEALLAQAVTAQQRRSAARRLALLRWRLSRERPGRPLYLDESYADRVGARLEGE